MRRHLWAWIGIACWLMSAAPATAGLYFADDIIPYPVPNDHKAFMMELTRLRPRPGPKTEKDPTGQAVLSSERLQKAVARLVAREKYGVLSLDDRIDLSAFYILLGKNEQARDLLLTIKEIAPREFDDFRVRSNLASAYDRLNDFERAIENLESALKNWPALHPGWSVKQLAWYRHVEDYYLALLKARNMEVVRRQPKNTIDEIFPDVPFAERGPDYLIGGMSDAVRMRLPPDALEIVRQLLFWHPTDQRLFWLYGELLNAQGDSGSAFEVMESLVYSQGLNFPLLRQHRSAHFQFRAHFPPAIQYRIFYVGIPSPLGISVYEKGRSALLGEVDHTYEVAAAAALTMQHEPLVAAACSSFYATASTEEKASKPAGKDAEAPTETISSLPDWKPLLAGFIGGVVVGVVAVFQVRLLQRRRAKRRSVTTGRRTSAPVSRPRA